ncbi:MAG: GGDEF domain-containing protein [Lachnospiraceae bacterium]|nr:GGDEF domain-containing protein [Lachnospiraceae bacterium]
MITKKDIKKSIDNTIRSLFIFVALVKDADDECVIIDQDADLFGIPGSDEGKNETVSFGKMRRSFIRNIHPEDRDAFRDFTDRDRYVVALGRHVHLSMELRLRHRDKKYYWSEIIICNTTKQDSTKGNDCLLMIRDIDERKSLELEREAEEREILNNLRDQYDALFEENMTDQQTGCYNRKGLRYYSDIVIDDAVKNDRDLFVCVADLNGLKHINDTYGHPAGDEAISAASRELKKAAPTGSKIVRIGGDEFLLFSAVDKDSKEPDLFAELVDDGIEAYNRTHSNPFSVGVSYGWVLLPPGENMRDLDEYIEMADEKMYKMRIERDKYRRE